MCSLGKSQVITFSTPSWDDERQGDNAHFKPPPVHNALGLLLSNKQINAEFTGYLVSHLEIRFLICNRSRATPKDLRYDFVLDPAYADSPAKSIRLATEWLQYIACLEIWLEVPVEHQHICESTIEWSLLAKMPQLQKLRVAFMMPSPYYVDWMTYGGLKLERRLKITNSQLVAGMMIKLISAIPKHVQVEFGSGVGTEEHPPLATTAERTTYGPKKWPGAAWWSPILGEFRLNDLAKWTPKAHQSAKEYSHWYELRYGPACPLIPEDLTAIYEKYRVLQGADIKAHIEDQ